MKYEFLIPLLAGLYGVVPFMCYFFYVLGRSRENGKLLYEKALRDSIFIKLQSAPRQTLNFPLGRFCGAFDAEKEKKLPGTTSSKKYDHWIVSKPGSVMGVMLWAGDIIIADTDCPTWKYTRDYKFLTTQD